MARPSENVSDPEKRALQAEAALEEMTAERNRLWAELHRRAANDRELADYKAAYHGLVSSKSWRLTAPLRSVGWFVRQVPEMRRRFLRFVATRPNGER